MRFNVKTHRRRSTLRPRLEELEDRTLLSGPYTDSFEAPVLNPFWSTVIQSGSISLSTAIDHTGKQSIEFDSTATSLQKYVWINHFFPTPAYGDVSVWVYDNGAGVLSSNYLFLDLHDSTGSRIAEIFTDDYDLGPGNNGDDYDFNVGNTGYESNVVRTQAWHQYAIHDDPGGLTVLLDGNILFSGAAGAALGQIQVGIEGPWWRPAWTAHFDDFAFYPAHFSVAAPASTVAGTSFNITITALDGSGQTASGYTGTVHFTSNDKKAALPADYTFTPADAGVHTFKVALVTAGSQTITATDTMTGSLTGKSSPIRVSAAAVDHLKVTAAANSTAGVAFSLTITAQDAFNNTVTGYTGTVHFTSTDIQAVLPAGFTFTSANKGVHTFSGVALKTAGTQSITATDTVTASVKGSATVAVKPGKASTLSISAPSTVTQSGAFTFIVTALDAYGNVATGYVGTVHFSSSDAAASLPGNFTFLSADAGVEAFSAIMNTTGTHSLTATDTVTSSITGTDPAIQVTAGVAAVREGSSLMSALSDTDLALRIASILEERPDNVPIPS